MINGNNRIYENSKSPDYVIPGIIIIIVFIVIITTRKIIFLTFAIRGKCK